MHGNGGHIRSCRHGGHRQIFSEVEMRSMGLVCQAQHTVAVGQPDNFPQIGADAIVGRVVHQNRLGVRILLNRLLHLLHLHAQRNPQAHIALWVYINRNRSAQNQRSHHASVDVSGQNNLISPLYHGKDHALYRRGGSSHHQKRVGRSERLSRQPLRLCDHRDWMAQVVKGLHGINVNSHALLPQQVY